MSSNSSSTSDEYKICRELFGYIHNVSSQRNPNAMKIIQGHNYPELEPWPDGQQLSWSNAGHYVLRNDLTNLVKSVGKENFITNLHIYISKHAEIWPPYVAQQRPLYRAAADVMCMTASEIINFSLSIEALESLGITVCGSNDAYDLLEMM
jgi:hypothetical protein